MSKNTETMELNADLKFTIEIDMNKFNEQVVKAGDYYNVREDYIKCQIPEKEIIEIFEDAVCKLNKLGYKTIKKIVDSNTPNPLRDFDKMMYKMFNSPLIKDIK